MSLILPASEPLQVPLDDDDIVAADARIFFEALAPAVRIQVGTFIELAGRGQLGKEFICPPTIGVATAHMETLFEGLQGDVMVRPHLRLHFSSIISRAFRLLDGMAIHDRALFANGARLEDVQHRMLGNPELYWMAVEALIRACQSHDGQPALAFERKAPLNTPCWAFSVARTLTDVMKASGAGHAGHVFSRLVRGLRVVPDEEQGRGRQAVAAWKRAAHEWLDAAAPSQVDAATMWAAKEVPIMAADRTFVVQGLGQFRVRAAKPAVRATVPVEVVPVVAAPPVVEVRPVRSTLEEVWAPTATEILHDQLARDVLHAAFPEAAHTAARDRRIAMPTVYIQEGVAVEPAAKPAPARRERRDFTVAERQAHRERKRLKAEAGGYDNAAGVLAENAVAAGHFARNYNKGRY
jgi:hypothetical protein